MEQDQRVSSNAGHKPGFRGGAEAHTHDPCARSFMHQVSLPVLAISPLSCAQEQVPWKPAVPMTPSRQWASGIGTGGQLRTHHGAQGHMGGDAVPADGIFLCRNQRKQVFQDSLISDTLQYLLSDDA